MCDYTGQSLEVNHHYFSSGVFNILIHNGHVAVDLLAGQFNVTQTGGDSTINIGPSLVGIAVCGGKMDLHIESGVSNIRTTGGYIKITSGPGYTYLDAEDGICYVKTPSNNGRTLVQLGNGITFIHCQQMKKFNKTGNCVSIGTGCQEQYQAEAHCKPNQCIIDGDLFENGNEVECFSFSLKKTRRRSKHSCCVNYKKDENEKKCKKPNSRAVMCLNHKPKIDLKQKCRQFLQDERKKKRAKILDEKRKLK